MPNDVARKRLIHQAAILTYWNELKAGDLAARKFVIRTMIDEIARIVNQAPVDRQEALWEIVIKELDFLVSAYGRS